MRGPPCRYGYMAALRAGPGLEPGDGAEFVFGSLFANAGSGWFGL